MVQTASSTDPASSCRKMANISKIIPNLSQTEKYKKHKITFWKFLVCVFIFQNCPTIDGKVTLAAPAESQFLGVAIAWVLMKALLAVRKTRQVVAWKFEDVGFCWILLMFNQQINRPTSQQQQVSTEGSCCRLSLKVQPSLYADDHSICSGQGVRDVENL